MAKAKPDTGERLICEHRRARFDYAFDDELEAGLVLIGSEVKALRQGEASLSDAYALPDGGNLVLHNAHIGAYKPATAFAHLPTRPRRLLMNRREIDGWTAKVRERGYSIIPLALYFKNGRVKVRLGLGKGKQNIDRRESMKERESQREVDRALRGRARRGE